MPHDTPQNALAEALAVMVSLRAILVDSKVITREAAFEEVMDSLRTLYEAAVLDSRVAVPPDRFPLDEAWERNQLGAGPLKSAGSAQTPRYDLTFCEHANENPNVCRCPTDCACRTTMCKDKASQPPALGYCTAYPGHVGFHVKTEQCQNWMPITQWPAVARTP